MKVIDSPNLGLYLAQKLILSELITFSNLRDGDLSNVHSNWHSAIDTTQLCLVSTSPGAQVLILPEFITFNITSFDHLGEILKCHFKISTHIFSRSLRPQLSKHQCT